MPAIRTSATHSHSLGWVSLSERWCNDNLNIIALNRANMGRERGRSNRGENGDLVFQRVDPPLGDFSGFDSMHDGEQGDCESVQSSVRLKCEI